MTIPVPRLKLYRIGWPNPTLTPLILTERKSACVLSPCAGTETRYALQSEAEIFDVKHRIRRHAEGSLAKLDLVLSLMAYKGKVPLAPDPADRFEAYLCLRDPVFLRELLTLLDMPDSSKEATVPELPRAA